MSADKRTPHTDALDTLGFIHQYEEQRDAIHLAVEPVEAGQDLEPGDVIQVIQGVAYKDNDRKEYGQGAVKGKVPMGIVDPFLLNPVKDGERFWCVLWPRTVKSLRHVWTHPDFPSEEEAKAEAEAEVKVRAEVVAQTRKDASEQWLRTFCKENDVPSFERVLEIGHGLAEGKTQEISEDDPYYKFKWNHAASSDPEWGRSWITIYGEDAHDEIPLEFWTHLEYVIGKSIPLNLRAETFSCSC